MSSTSSIPTSGDYILNFAKINAAGTVSGVMESVKVTFNSSTSFTINETTYKYNFTWGSNGST